MNTGHRLSASPALIDLFRLAGPIRRIFDCGSRDALDGIHLLESLAAQELHTFECNPDALALCRRNIEASGSREKITLVPKAIAAKAGKLTFYAIDPERTETPHLDGNIGASSLFRANNKYSKERYVQRPIQVEAISLDEYCSNVPPPDLLWMDLQGAEAMALDGAKNVLPEIRVIHVEVAFRRVYLDQALFRDVHARLKDGFQLREVDLGRWPRFPKLYSALNFGPWIGNAVYVNRGLLRS